MIKELEIKRIDKTDSQITVYCSVFDNKDNIVLKFIGPHGDLNKLRLHDIVNVEFDCVIEDIRIREKIIDDRGEHFIYKTPFITNSELLLE